MTTEPGQPGSLWTPEEDLLLLKHVIKYGTKHWGHLKSSGALAHRDQKACCNRFILLRRKFFHARAKGQRLTFPMPVQQLQGGQQLQALLGDPTGSSSSSSLQQGDPEEQPTVQHHLQPPNHPGHVPEVPSTVMPSSQLAAGVPGPSKPYHSTGHGEPPLGGSFYLQPQTSSVRTLLPPTPTSLLQVPVWERRLPRCSTSLRDSGLPSLVDYPGTSQQQPPPSPALPLAGAGPSVGSNGPLQSAASLQSLALSQEQGPSAWESTFLAEQSRLAPPTPLSAQLSPTPALQVPVTLPVRRQDTPSPLLSVPSSISSALPPGRTVGTPGFARAARTGGPGPAGAETQDSASVGGPPKPEPALPGVLEGGQPGPAGMGPAGLGQESVHLASTSLPGEAMDALDTSQDLSGMAWAGPRADTNTEVLLVTPDPNAKSDLWDQLLAQVSDANLCPQ